MIKRLLRFGIVVLFLSLSVHVHAADSGTVNVTAHSGGSPVANVSVVVRSWVNPIFELTVQTDSDGHAIINNVPLGDLDVFALNEQGDVVSKYAGKLSVNDEIKNVLLEL